MQENTNQTPVKSGSSFGWGVLGFFIPLVGLILFIAWKNDKPQASKAAGIGALIGFIGGILLTIIVIIIMFVGLGALGAASTTTSTPSYYYY